MRFISSFSLNKLETKYQIFNPIGKILKKEQKCTQKRPTKLTDV
jgi:hypothetical protein